MEPKTVGRESDEQIVQACDTYVSGLCAETTVMTMEGELRACDLVPGDRIITRDVGMAILRDVRRKTITADAVTIKAGSLGHRKPPSDTMMPAGQKILIRDWRADAVFGEIQALVPAHRLQDGEFIRLLEAQKMDIIELIFDAPFILYAGGLEVQSF